MGGVSSLCAVFEPGEFFEKGQGDFAYGAVALFGDDELGLSGGVGFVLVGGRGRGNTDWHGLARTDTDAETKEFVYDAG